MEILVLIGGGLVLTSALIVHPTQTVTLVTTAITLKGASFLARKISETTNKGNAEIIHLTGWCLAGVPLIGLLKLSLDFVSTIKDGIITMGSEIGSEMHQIANLIDKITFWN